MIKYGNDLGEDSNFGVSLCLIGESFKLMAGIKYALEDDVKQSFWIRFINSRKMS